MAKFHIYVKLALFHPPNTQFFFAYYFLMVVVDQFQKKLEIPPPKTRRENAFLKNGFKESFLAGKKTRPYYCIFIIMYNFMSKYIWLPDPYDYI